MYPSGAVSLTWTSIQKLAELETPNVQAVVTALLTLNRPWPMFHGRGRGAAWSLNAVSGPLVMPPP